MIDRDIRQHFVCEFRNARAAALGDAENFMAIVFVLERLGSLLVGRVDGLYGYRDALSKIARQSSVYELLGTHWGLEFESLYAMVRRSRNDNMHTGALARHATTNAISVALIMEDALMTDSHKLSDFMVTEPICAAGWQPLGLIRQKMLENSFSFLPIRISNDESRWQLVSDSAIARLIRCETEGKRKKLLAKSASEIVAAGLLVLDCADCFVGETPVEQVIHSVTQKPILIIREQDSPDLVGLVTAFDLL